MPLMHTAVPCVNLSVEHSSLSGGLEREYFYGEEVEVLCDMEYHVIQGNVASSRINITCTESLLWNHNIPACTRKWNFPNLGSMM